MPMTTAPKNTDKPRRRGRPRKAGNSSGNPRETIVASAIKLFKEKGYAKTSLSEISRQVGIDQSSIYYWFSSKEAILESLFKDQNSQQIIKSIAATDEPYTKKLFALIIFDVVSKCDLPFDFIELEALIHDKKSNFEFVLDDYRTVYQGLVSFIEKGIETGEFKPCNAGERAVAILSVSEGLQHHYHSKIRGELILEASGYTVQNLSPEEIGCMAGKTVLPSLLTDSPDFNQLAEDTLALLAKLSLQEKHNTPEEDQESE
ncbi:MAG: TetR/AcrR family transcriptional regulator [Anaerotardibacter sp.]